MRSLQGRITCSTLCESVAQKVVGQVWFESTQKRGPILVRGVKTVTQLTQGFTECVDPSRKCCVGHRMCQAPPGGVGDCVLCHGWDSDTESDAPEQSRQVAEDRRGFFPLQPWQACGSQERWRIACDSSHKSDGIHCSRQTGVPGTSTNARFGRIGGGFGQCPSLRHIYRCPVLPHIEFWPFLGRPPKDVLEFFQIFGPASSPHTVSILWCLPLCLPLVSCFGLGCVLCLTEDLVRCTLCSVWHGCLYQWSLDSLRLHKAINTEQSRKQRKQNTEENQDEQK